MNFESRLEEYSVGLSLDCHLASDEGSAQSASEEALKCNFCTLEEQGLPEATDVNLIVTQVELAKLIGKSPRTVKARTVSLQERGLVRRVGGKRNGRWEILVDVEGESV